MGVFYAVATEKMTPIDYEKKVAEIHAAISKGELTPRDGFTLTGKLFEAQIHSFSRSASVVPAAI